MIHQNVQKLINNYQEILDQDPMDQMEDTLSILTRFACELDGVAKMQQQNG